MRKTYEHWREKSPLWQRLAVGFVILVFLFGLLFGFLCFLLSRDLFLSVILGLGGGLLVAGMATYNGWRSTGEKSSWNS